MSEKRVVLLVGSPKGIERSTSYRLGRVVLDVLKERGFATDAIHVHSAMRSSDDLERALAAVATADLVIMSLPLYVDSFPAPVIGMLEKIADRRAGAGRVQFALVIQCGFPESSQNAVALSVAERFAAEAGWEWLGALSLGGLETYGSADPALQVAATALAEGKKIPDIALKKAMPAWLYRIGGNIMWRRVAKKNGVARKLRARPYEN